jgi:hypothetical protein
MKKLTSILAASMLLLFGFQPHAHSAVGTPTGVELVNASSTGAATNAASLTVRWSAVTGAIGYVVTISATGESDRTASVAFSSGVTTYQTTFDNLTGGTTYSVVVQSSDAATPRTTAVSAASTKVAQSVPSSPGISSQTAGVGQATLTWTAPTNTGGSAITGYTISASGLASSVVVSAITSSKVITGLTAGTPYAFTITANNTTGSSFAASFASLTTPTTPSAPLAPSASVSSTTLNVTWTAPANGGSTITGYTVSLYSATNLTSVLQTSSVTGFTSTSFTGLAAGDYAAKVVATNLVGDGTASPASTTQTIAAAATTTDNTPTFSTSANSAVAVGANSAAITATAPSGGSVTISAVGNPAGACTYNAGVITGVAAGLCILTANVAALAPYAIGTATKTVSISKSLQTITFNAITPKTMPGPLTVTATASSALTVAFSASGTCSVTGTTVTYTGAGSCSITASQAGNAEWGLATAASGSSLTRTFTISKNTQTINFTLPSGTDANLPGPGTITGASATSGLSITYASSTTGVCTVSGTSIAYIAIGTCTIVGSQSGNDSYLAGTATKSLSIAAAGTVAVNSGNNNGPIVPTPSPSATPTPTPSVTATPTPTPSVTATPTPTPSVTATPTPSASAAPKPPVSVAVVVPAGVKASKTVAVVGNSAATSVAPSKSVQLTIPSIPKGTAVTVTLTDSKGKQYTIADVKSSGSKTFSPPALSFPKAGTYKVSVKYGKVTKVITVVVKK